MARKDSIGGAPVQFHGLFSRRLCNIVQAGILQGQPSPMRKFYLPAILFFLFCADLPAQTANRWNMQRSAEILVYRIPADSAERYLSGSRPDPASWYGQVPFITWHDRTRPVATLPAGHYLFFTLEKHELRYEYFNQTQVQVRALNNNHRVQLEVRDPAGELIRTATLKAAGRTIPYQPSISGFTIPDKNPDELLLRVETPGDTCFLDLASVSNYHYPRHITGWMKFKNSWTMKALRWPVSQVFKLTSGNYRHRKTVKGYILFNKAIYRIGDTVKLKGYVLNKHNRRVNRPLNLDLVSDPDYEEDNIRLGKIPPSHPGSFHHEFVLGDSLDSDETYTIRLYDRKGRSVSGEITVEDYVNDEVATHEFRSLVKEYTRGDSMLFTASAKDAAGLPLMDGTVRFYLIAGSATGPQADLVYVPDTLMRMIRPLLVDSETRFAVPASAIPAASMRLRAEAVFVNSNNETHTETVDVGYSEEREQVVVRTEGAWLHVEYRLLGVATDTTGYFSTGKDPRYTATHFPARIRIHPYAGHYFFSAGQARQQYMVESAGQSLNWRNIQEKDSCGFAIDNPMGLLVHYTVSLGKKVIATGADTTVNITWKQRLKKNTAYDVRLRWIWQDAERNGQFILYALDKLLNASVAANETVYPGQTDKVKIVLTDRKGRPAENVNLTAVTYNAQHKDHIRVPTPPYLDRMRYRPGFSNGSFSTSHTNTTGSFLLAGHDPIRQKFSTDTLVYYQLLKPAYPYRRVSMVTTDSRPQLSVYVVKKGVPQEIHILSVNNQLVYYNDVTDKAEFSFHGVHGFNRLTIRLDSFRVVIDSIYLQPYYKHHLSFDLDSLPAGAVKYAQRPELTPSERLSLQQSIVRFESHVNARDAWVWQGDRIFYLDKMGTHQVGPFDPSDSVTYYKPGGFDLKFRMENDFVYRVSRGLTRMVHQPMFDPKKPALLRTVPETLWQIADTIPDAPVISYEKQLVTAPFLETSGRTVGRETSNAWLQLHLPADTIFRYAVLYNQDTVIIRNPLQESVIPVKAGNYNLVLVTAAHHYLLKENLLIRADGRTLLSFSRPDYSSSNDFINQLREKQQAGRQDRIRHNQRPLQMEKIPGNRILQRMYPEGSALVQGRVIDKQGREPIPQVSIRLEGFEGGATTDEHGMFRLPGLKTGRYTLVAGAIGYGETTVDFKIAEGGKLDIPVELDIYRGELGEVVLTAYGTTKRKSVTGAISIVSSQKLQGRVAGVSIVQSVNKSSRIVIRGSSSVTSNARPIYVVDGVVMDLAPDESTMAVSQVEVLRDAAASAIYGARADQGVIIITTNGFRPPAMREKFRDYANWIPDLLTDRNGEVTFDINYPDNLTGWETHVVGMDRKRRYVKATFFTRTFKPVVAQLFGPSFLVDGDSAVFTGKLINYTSETKELQWQFSGGPAVQSGSYQLQAGASEAAGHGVMVQGTDTLSAAYKLHMANGYGDGETKKIPVLPLGTMETIGKFWMLDRDTTITFSPDTAAGPVHFYAMANTTDLMLQELDGLRLYPWFCLEQTASKLRGLILEREIRKQLNEPFKYEKMVAYLLDKIQTSQLPNGGWPWWKGGPSDHSVSSYVMRCLTDLPANPLLNSTIRSGLLFLENSMKHAGESVRLESLYSMSEAKHSIDYVTALRTMEFDSLDIHQQWLFARVLQNAGSPVQVYLDKLMLKKQGNVLGNVYWGEEHYRWYSNAMATTVLAFRTLAAAGGYEQDLKGMVGYFLDKRSRGHWNNTVETASVLSVMLPYIMKQQSRFTSPPQVVVNSMNIDRFPKKLTLDPATALQVSKTGGGIVYLTLSQEIFNREPEPVSGQFVIDTWFEVAGRRSAVLTAGANAVMKITLDLKKDAEYVQFEIPIPAGCTYAAKPQGTDGIHREYLKDRMAFFVPFMRAGKYEYEIRLEPRYTGIYHINPAKSALMYFPVFYGRTGIKTMAIEK
ncbi:MAG: hypothetical protein EOO09_03365 [Chitinophagaceae bacterium]|nr:MAG: hypothetical protein EOO09_03365 [Chitinophagaceae bacterium]